MDGAENTGLAGNLLELTIVARAGEPCRCNARFVNWGPASGGTGFLYFDRALLDFGKNFAVTIGATGAATLFDGRIFGLEAGFPEGAPADIAVLAADRLEDLRMLRRTRSFEDVSDADVARRIAGDHGLTADVDLNGPTHKVLAQINQSDYAFLYERVTAAGAMLWIEGRTLHVGNERALVSAAPRLVWGEKAFAIAPS